MNDSVMNDSVTNDVLRRSTTDDGPRGGVPASEPSSPVPVASRAHHPSTGATPIDRAAWPGVGIAVVVLVKVVLGLAVGDRYGWHRDELYYRVAGLHPAFGYVDFPPVTPMLARLAEAIAPGNLVVLRSLAVGAGAGVVVLATLTARELGGGRRAQVLTAIAVAVAPFLYGSNALFQTVSFDQLAWAAVVLTVVRVLRRDDGRGWAAAGAAAGLALETKYTAIVLLVAVGIGMLATASGRRVLGRAIGAPRGRRSLLLGSVWLLALIAPNLWWQRAHGWPTIGFFADAPAGTGVLTFLPEVSLLAGPVGFVLAVVGWVRLWRSPRWRPLAVVPPAVVALFVISGGKSYYAAPALPVLLAAGAIEVEAWLGRRRDRGRVLIRAIAAAVVVAGLVVAPGVVPVLPVGVATDLGLVEGRQDWADEIGWPELAATVEHAFVVLDPDERSSAGILTTNYGQAGAVSLHAPELPEPASTQATHRFWSGDRPRATVVVTVGFTLARLEAVCTDVEPVARVDNDLGIDNIEHGALVAICRTPTALDQLRVALAD